MNFLKYFYSFGETVTLVILLLLAKLLLLLVILCENIKILYLITQIMIRFNIEFESTR